MSLDLKTTEAIIASSGFIQTGRTAKLVEFKSLKTGRMLYVYDAQGFPSHADVIIDPSFNHTPLLAIPNVAPNKRVEFRHGSNMASFPRRLNRGKEPEHYGRALYVSSASALQRLCLAYA